MKKKVLITGALGQIGTEVCSRFRSLYGKENVIATDVIIKEESGVCSDGNFAVLDVLNIEDFQNIVKKNNINYIVHLASLLSASGEANPQKLWQLNMGSLYNALEICRTFNAGFFTPSSIASFGNSTPKINTPQDVLQRPSTIYGISKVAGELLCDYYFLKYGVDTRGLRLPGLISHAALPGGGTTDYAVDIYYKALSEGVFTCPLKEDTYLDMMYMDDAIDAIIKLIEADPSKLKHRNAFNVSAMSICPRDVAKEIQKHIREFKILYNVNPILQAIAESWPRNMDCSAAKEEWGFEPKFNLESMTKEMLTNLQSKIVA